jgi:integrase
MPSWRVGKLWRAQFQHLGRRFSKSGFATKKEAHRWQTERLKELEQEAKTPRQMPSSKPDSLSLGALMLQYMAVAERTLAPKTLSYRKTTFRRFLAHVGNIPADSIGTTQVEGYLLTRPTNHNFNKDRVELHRLFSWGFRRLMVPANPVALVEKVPVQKEKKVIPTPQEMARILMAAGPDRPLLMVLFHTLARIDEVLRLKWEDVNFEQKTIRLWTRKRHGGSWESDWLPMNSDLEAVLWGLWQKKTQSEYVFLNPKTGTRYLYRPKLMATICKRAGVPKYGFHCVRHFVASYLYDKLKVSLPMVSKLLRHKSMAITEIYLQTIDQSSREAMKMLEGNILGFVQEATGE